MPDICFGNRRIGDNEPTYFIADVGANHDGSLERAKGLIHLAAEAGADAAKFQNFEASKIVSDHGFRHLEDKESHQARWKKSVFEVYQDASIALDWTPVLKAECEAAGIDYFSSPYDFDAVDHLAPFVDIYKIGSGDITWPEMLRKIAQQGKPVFLATGASSIGEVQDAVEEILAINPNLVLMQCNTNYTGSLDNFRHSHLNVLTTYRTLYPELVLGLSDHTPGHATTLGAVTLGARVVEKHFTDDTRRVGPDHAFAMDPRTWREMVDRTRELELALGSHKKFVCENERKTVVVQRRCLRARTEMAAGAKLERTAIDVLRPAPPESIKPFDLPRVLGATLRKDIQAGECLRWDMLEFG